MSDALNLLRRVYVSGATVAIVNGDQLQLRGRPLPDDLKAALKANRADVLAILREQDIGSVHGNYVYRYAAPCAIKACRHLGPCSQFLMGHGCGLETILRDTEPAQEPEEATS